VAVDPEPVDRHLLHAMQRQLADVLPGGWLADDDLHLTLRFLGDLDEAAAGQVVARCAALAAVTPPSVALTTGIEAWPAQRPRLLVLAVSAAPPLIGLQRALQALPGTAPVDSRPWRPHITLRRARIGGAPFLPSGVALSSVTCRTITLFARAEAGATSRYRRLASWPLQEHPGPSS
jgi:RNA 2',3'-cyclic 3'-phosphodiesterase